MNFHGQIKDTIEDCIEDIDFEKLQKNEIEFRNSEKIQELEYVLGEGHANVKVRRVATVDLDVPVQEYEDKDNDELLEEETTKTTLSKKDLTIKQEVDLNRLSNEYKTLGQEINKPDASKLVIADDLDLSELSEEEKEKFKSSASGYYLLIMNEKGEFEPSGFEEDYATGTHPEEKNYQIEHDGDVVKDDVIARFRIPGTQKTIAIDNGAYGEIQAFYSPGKTRDGNDPIDKQLETDNVWPIHTDVRNTIGKEHDPNGTYGIDESVEEARVHDEEHGETETLSYLDADGDEKTSLQKHMTYEQYVDKIMENDEIASTYNREDIKEFMEEYKIENNIENLEKITEKMEEELNAYIEQKAEQEHEQPGQNNKR